MSTDKNGWYSNGQAAAASMVGESVVEHAGDGGRGPGPSRDLYLVISCKTTVTTMSGTGTFTIAQSASDTSWSGTVIGTYTCPQNPAAGTVVAQVAVPTITQKYTRVDGTLTGWSGGAGAFDIYLTDSPQANRS